MDKYVLQEALNEIDDSYVLEAAAPASPAGKIFRRFTAALVAAAAVFVLLFGLPIQGQDGVITGPGVLVVKAESATEDTEIILEAVDTGATNACVHSVVDRYGREFAGVAFSFSMPENFRDAALRLTVDSGMFFQPGYCVKAVDNGYVVTGKYAQLFPSNEPFVTQRLNNTDGLRHFRWINLDAYAPAFVEIVLLEEEHIVGYAVIKISPIEDLGSELGYVSQLLRSVSFPQVDGAYQDISEEYVAEQIRRAKADAASQYPTYIAPDAVHKIETLKERTALRSQSHLLQEDIRIFRETVEEFKAALADKSNRISDTNVWIVRDLSHILKNLEIGKTVYFAFVSHS